MNSKDRFFYFFFGILSLLFAFTLHAQVVQWTFNEGSGTQSSDKTGLNHTATLNGALWTTGHLGGGISVDPSGNFASVADATDLRFSTFSISLWVKKNNEAGLWSRIIGKGLNYGLWDAPAGDKTILFQIYMTDGSVLNVPSAAQLNVGTWYHVAATYDSASGVANLYINGTLNNSNTASTGKIPIVGTDPVTIGSTGPNNWIGVVDDTRLYNQVLTSTEVAALVTQDETTTPTTPPPTSSDIPGLVSQWRLNEGAGLQSVDSTGHNYIANLLNGANWVVGHEGNAVNITGTGGGYLSVNDSPALRFTRGLSFSLWVKKTNEAGLWSRIFGKGWYLNTGDPRNYGLWDSPGTDKTLLFQIHMSDGNWLNLFSTGAAGQLDVGTWYHVVCTYENNIGKIYINGVLNNTVSVAGTGIPMTSLDPLTIGQGGENIWFGVTDDIRLFNRGLTSSEASLLYSLNETSYGGSGGSSGGGGGGGIPTGPSSWTAVNEKYIRGLDLSGSLAGAGGIGGLIACISGGVAQFYHSDGVGSITATVNAAQNVTGAWQYDAFGSLVASSGDVSVGGLMGYSGKPAIGGRANGDYYYGYRFYSASTQRWFNRDPLDELGGINLYGFVGNNPVGNVDPHGLLNIGLSPAQVMALQEVLKDAAGPSLIGAVNPAYWVALAVAAPLGWLGGKAIDAYYRNHYPDVGPEPLVPPWEIKPPPQEHAFNMECTQFARDAHAYFKKKGYNPRYIIYQSLRDKQGRMFTRILENKERVVIGSNGYHEGVFVMGRVYDNWFSTQPIPLKQWIWDENYALLSDDPPFPRASFGEAAYVKQIGTIIYLD